MKIKVDYLFSKNDKIGSKVISWGTSFIEPQIEDVPSHTAILINNRWVFESTLESGVRRISYQEWLKINKEVCKIPCTQERTLEGIIEEFRQIKDKKYDYIGLVYFGLRVLLFICFRLRIPKKNILNRKNSYFCSEVVGKMTGIDCQMTAPVTLMSKLKNDVEFLDITKLDE